jgi:hypothetical protein
MARLRAMRKNVTVRKKKPVLKDIPDDYDDLIDSGKKSKFIPLKRDGKYNKKDLDF